MIPTRGAAALGLTAVALALLLSFRTPDQLATHSTALTGAAGGASGTTGSTGTTGASGSTGAVTDQSGSRTVDGQVVSTRYGDVQVEVTIAGGRVTDVQALQLPDGDRHSASISARVESTLRSQALTAQRGQIDGVSGATYTSTAYAQSLQSALDAAGL